MPRQYEAVASILVTGETAQIKLEPNYQTVTDWRIMDAASFRRTLALLARNLQVEREVVAEMEGQQGIRNLAPGALASKVNVTAVEGTNLMQIVVRADTSAEAERLATAWAEVFVKYANALYSERAGVLPGLEMQLVEARRLYDEAQEALADYLRSNMAEETKRQIDAKRMVLNDHYALMARLKVAQNRAAALRQTLEAGGGGSALQSALDSLAVFDLQAPLLSTGTSSLSTVQITVDENAGMPSESGAAKPLQRLDQLLRSIESQIEKETAFVAQSTLNQEILDLSAELEKKNAQLRELTQQRDSAWEGYTTVVNKVTEVTVSAAPSGTIVRLAAPGRAGAAKTGPGLATVAIAGLLVGLMLAAADLILYRLLHSS
jgi:uncharacterized protein involved in exopolysaccharide biosynthesis